jgi:capsular polysaccharide biosynthesis protein
MELAEYIDIIKRHMWAFVVVVSLITLLAVLFSAVRPAIFDTALSLDIAVAQREETQDFQFNGYYAIQSSELFADTLVSWLESPDVVVTVYDRSGVALPSDNVSRLTRVFDAEKLSSQHVKIAFANSSTEQALAIVSGLEETIQEKAAALNETSQGTTSFHVIFSEPIVKEKPRNLALNGIIGLIVGLMVGCGVAFTWEYFSKQKVA